MNVVAIIRPNTHLEYHVELYPARGHGGKLAETHGHPAPRPAVREAERIAERMGWSIVDVRDEAGDLRFIAVDTHGSSQGSRARKRWSGRTVQGMTRGNRVRIRHSGATGTIVAVEDPTRLEYWSGKPTTKPFFVRLDVPILPPSPGLQEIEHWFFAAEDLELL
jgi:hypothetical protein